MIGYIVAIIGLVILTAIYLTTKTKGYKRFCVEQERKRKHNELEKLYQLKKEFDAEINPGFRKALILGLAEVQKYHETYGGWHKAMVEVTLYSGHEETACEVTRFEAQTIAYKLIMQDIKKLRGIDKYWECDSCGHVDFEEKEIGCWHCPSGQMIYSIHDEGVEE